MIDLDIYRVNLTFNSMVHIISPQITVLSRLQNHLVDSPNCFCPKLLCRKFLRNCVNNVISQLP